MWADASPNGAARRTDPTAALRERIAILEEENRQLRDLLVPQIALPSEWRLCRNAEIFLVATRAAAPGYLSRERALHALYGFDDRGCPQKLLDHWLWRVRRAMREHCAAIQIRTVRGRGYLMPPESVTVFDRLTAS